MRRLARMIVVLVTAMVIEAAAMAQSSTLLYGSSRNPQNNAVNPAFFPSKSHVYVALPSVNFDLKSPLSFSSIFQNSDSVDYTVINVNNLLDSLQNDGRMRFGMDVHPIGLGVNIMNTFVTFSSDVKANAGLGFPTGLNTLLKEGNVSHTGDNYIELLDGELLAATVYSELALGVGHKFSNLFGGDLTVGARAKMLFGYYSITTGGSSLRLYTAEDYSSMTAKADLCVQTAGIDLSDFAMSDITGNLFSENRGFGFDLGVRYEWGKFDFSASILDIGKGIEWKENLKKVVSSTPNVTFEGLDINDFLMGNDTTGIFSTIIDSLKTIMDTTTVEGETFYTPIPTKLNLGAMMNIGMGFSAGVLFRGQFNRGVTRVDDVFKTTSTGFTSNTTIMARYNFKDWVEVSGSFSVITNNGHFSWFNPGIAATLSPGKVFQLYFMLDYISSIYIIDSKNVNFSIGLNVII